MLTIAAIFHSHRIGNSSYLQKLLDEKSLLKDPYLVTVASFSLYFDHTNHHKEMQQQIKVAYSKLGNITKSLINTPANKLRFTNLDLIESEKKVIIITEGPTDTEILEHAYTTLTDGKIPYWKIRPAGDKSGGAKEVKFTLDKSKPLCDDGTVIIGIFDHDTEGVNQFDGLNFEYFEDYKRVKKMNGANVFGIKLPVPSERTNYVEQERENFYLAIEHYFNDDLLIEFDLVRKSRANNLLKIKDTKSAKSKFAKHIKTIHKAEIFKNFIPLFQTIDRICGHNNEDYFKLLD